MDYKKRPLPNGSGAPAAKKAKAPAKAPAKKAPKAAAAGAVPVRLHRAKNTADENIALQALLEVGGLNAPDSPVQPSRNAPPMNGPVPVPQKKVSKPRALPYTNGCHKKSAVPACFIAAQQARGGAGALAASMGPLYIPMMTPKPERSTNEQGRGKEVVIESLTPSLCGAEFGHGSGATTADIVLSGRYFTIKIAPGPGSPGLHLSEDYYKLTLHMADESLQEVTRESLIYTTPQPDRPVLDFRVEKEPSDGPRSVTLRVRVWVASKQVGNRLLCVGINLAKKGLGFSPDTRVYTSGFRSVPKLTKKHKSSAFEAGIQNAQRRPAFPPPKGTPVVRTSQGQGGSNWAAGGVSPSASAIAGTATAAATSFQQPEVGSFFGKAGGVSLSDRVMGMREPIYIEGCLITPAVEQLLEIIADPEKEKEIRPIARILLLEINNRRKNPHSQALAASITGGTAGPSILIGNRPLGGPKETLPNEETPKDEDEPDTELHPVPLNVISRPCGMAAGESDDDDEDDDEDDDDDDTGVNSDMVTSSGRASKTEFDMANVGRIEGEKRPLGTGALVRTPEAQGGAQQAPKDKIDNGTVAEVVTEEAGASASKKVGSVVATATVAATTTVAAEAVVKTEKPEELALPNAAAGLNGALRRQSDIGLPEDMDDAPDGQMSAAGDSENENMNQDD